ncbi:M48 family metallopeptidase, partial [Mesotoga sp. B105.6.4]|uniref:tetratricopeptide repeat protein n=1 Tax=Mesotoga sp. B105.6.4 TaxID=1582224 RepID=UPI002155A578
IDSCNWFSCNLQLRTCNYFDERRNIMEERIAKTMALLLDGRWSEAVNLYHLIIDDHTKKESFSETIQNGEKSQCTSKAEKSVSVASEFERWSTLNEQELWDLGHIAYLFDDTETAESLIEEHYSRKPNDIEGMVFLGKIYKKRKKPYKSELMFRAALSEDKDHMKAAEELVYLYLDTDRPLDALAWAQKLLRLDPRTPKSYFLAGKALENLDKPEQSRRYIIAGMILDLSSSRGSSFQNFYEDKLGESITIADLDDAREIIEEWVGKNQHAVDRSPFSELEHLSLSLNLLKTAKQAKVFLETKNFATTNSVFRE